MVSLDGQHISYQQAVMRDIVPVLVLPVWIWAMLYFAIKREFPPTAMYMWAVYLNFYWTVLELITMLFNQQRRAIHDYIAKTVVIRVKMPF